MLGLVTTLDPKRAAIALSSRHVIAHASSDRYPTLVPNLPYSSCRTERRDLVDPRRE